MSYFKPLPPYPAFDRTPKRSNNAIIITMMIITLIAIAVAIVIYAIYRGRAVDPISRCEPGLCVVTLDTGEKRCPSSNAERLTYNTVFEDCTSGNYCQSNNAPCAVLAGGVLDCTGVCGPGNERCRCEAAPV